MPGSNTSISRSSNPLTGVRRPRHPGMIAGQALRTLRPFALQPIRPGEILESVSMVGDIRHNALIDTLNAPFTHAEVAVWFIPLHAYGPEFTALFTTDAEDIVQRGTFGDIEGAPGDANNPDPFENRITSGGLSQLNRPWAGEIGDPTDTGSTYVPWASHGAYIVADSFYGLDTTLDFRDDALLGNPPFVSDFVRGATLQSRDINIGLDSISSNETSLTQLLENMFLMTTPDRTFPEILAGFGVDPHRASGMPVPILTEQMMLRAPEDHYLHGQSTGVSSQNNDSDEGWQSFRYGAAVSPDPDQGHVWNDRPFGQLMTPVNINRKRGIRANTFGMLMATSVVYNTQGLQQDYGHMFDATRLLNLGHWGDPSFGGIEEIDFITIQDLYNREGTTDATQQAFNLLNLYMHGDIFVDHDRNDRNVFSYRGPDGEVVPATRLDFTTKVSTQFNIRTDLVG
ncbi:TPA_asm: major capsid protein [Microviridae sp.]|nr:TPA_asm: major capsid protein [Microviridae sp.]